MDTAEPMELDSSFLGELQPLNEDVRHLAALATLHRLRPSNELTVEGLLTGLHAHKELWAVIGSLGIVEFAQALTAAASRAAPPPRRPRLTEEQKGSLKAAILRVLAGHPHRDEPHGGRRRHCGGRHDARRHPARRAAGEGPPTASRTGRRRGDSHGWREALDEVSDWTNHPI